MSKKDSTSLSLIAKAILTAIVAGALDSKTVVEQTQLKPGQVGGAIAGLKKKGYIVTNAAGELKPTALGKATIAGPKAPREGSKMAKALEVVQKLSGKDRSEIIEHLMKDVKLTKAGAATYLSMLSKRLAPAAAETKAPDADTAAAAS